ncbi:MAG: Asp23/Gls24 family envelope stress response protein [Oscillospiraceae bacterium]
MIRTENHLGYITFSRKYLKTLIRHTAEGCFGVAGMNPYGAKQGFAQRFLQGGTDNSGVLLHCAGKREKLVIDLHISVTIGVNIAVISDSIANKVRFAVEEEAGVPVEKVNVFVDGIKA